MARRLESTQGRTVRRTWTMLLVGLAMIFSVVGGGTPATADEVAPSAYPTCNATQANLSATYENGNWITLEIYWDGANGTNCAYLRHGSAAPSGAIYTFVDLWTCTTATQGASCTPRGPLGSRYRDRDEGNFHEYAGKVTVDGRDRCIYAWGGIDTNGNGLADRFIDVNGSTDPAAPALGKHCA